MVGVDRHGTREDVCTADSEATQHGAFSAGSAIMEKDVCLSGSGT